MVRQGSTRKISIGLILLTIIQTTVSFATVYYATTIKNGTRGQNQGSTEGSTLLWIRGKDFAQDGFSPLPTVATTYVVKLTGDYSIYDCKIQPEQVTDSWLPCYTSAMPTGTYQVRIYENGYLIPINPDTYENPAMAVFLSSTTSTPKIQSITPATGLLQRLVTLSGDFKTNCYTLDVAQCSSDNTSLISRVYIGGQSCNLLDPTSNSPYSTINSTYLQCLFESNEVGVFNVTVIVTNGYGRSSTDYSLYRLSGTGQLYSFQSYAIISDISPSNGSIQGGTILNINGQYFSNSSRYPLTVNIDDEPCIILNTNLTNIQCQTPTMPTDNRSHYHGGRGLQAFYENVFTNLSNLGNSSLPMPSVNANQTWLDGASFILQNASNSTVWLIGYLRPPMTATFTFLLNTNNTSILFLSTDENPNNKVQIANNTSPQSSAITLQNNTNYYMFCVGSTRNKIFQLSIKAKMQEALLTTAGNAGITETQKIVVGTAPVVERQRIVYSTSSIIAGTPEVQNVAVINELFQIGFRGAYTSFLEEAPGPEMVETALNDLPTIYPLAVTVTIDHISYQITFPVEMGDVPPLTIISSIYTIPQNATEIVKGNASGSRLAFELNGATTHFLDFWSVNITTEQLQTEFNQLFTIRCPPSLTDPQASATMVYVNDFEDGSSYYDTTPLADRVFCGRNAVPRSNPANLVLGNTQTAGYMCFAYKLPIGISITMKFKVETDEDPFSQTIESIVIPLMTDTQWHYTCIDLQITLVQHNIEYLGVDTFLIIDVSLDSIPDGVMFDTISLHTTRPDRYEDSFTIASLDQPSSGSCTFPFLYNGQYYNKCTLDDNNLPICRSTSNQTYYCGSSSIEGVRRLFPKYQLLNNQLSITHFITNRTIDISFRYTACNSPTLIKALPPTLANVTSITTASKPIGGTYDIMFKGQTYSSIPANIDASNLVDLLQSFSTFGYVTVTRDGECGQYSYTIGWLSKGNQPLISIINSTNVTPIGAPINVSTIQQGDDGNIFYDVPNDILRTYHRQPQVEVIVGGYSSYCSNVNNSCKFQYLVEQTPVIISVVQNGIILTINGNGFNPSTESNTVLIGEEGSCNVTTANTTLIICTIINSPSGKQLVQVNVDEKGFASSNMTFIINVPLTITSFTPMTGGAGGGYVLTINGNGFSSNAMATIDGNSCTNSLVVNYSTILCTVPSSLTQSTSQVVVSVIDGTNSVNGTSLFTYNITNTPTISSIEPTVVTMTGGLLNITGTGFGNSSVSVFVGIMNASVLSSSPNYIQINLPMLSPGLYPITIQTSMGFARPLVNVEYRFYIQAVTPQISSLYGSTDIYVHGEGFNNSTSINFRDQNNLLYPCQVTALLSNRIQCRTVTFAKQVTITANGTHPIYGSGFAWLPLRQTVEQGTIVTWSWTSSELLKDRFYKVQQVSNAYTTEPVIDGFDSGPATLNGSFSYQFNTLGTFYYWSLIAFELQEISMRGVIDVIPSQPQILTIEATWNNFAAQTCVFPFTFNSINYTECTSINDTQLWCSPTSIYTGQRLYCTLRNSTSNSTCSSNTINGSACGQIIPTPSNATQLLATLCTVASITSISPMAGTVGTLLTITGTNFDGNLCEYDVEIGSIYHCPLISMTSNQLTCQIGNGSMLDARTSQIVRVIRHRQGYLGSNSQLRFRFFAAIFNISPNIGSIYGGTKVTIEGDGFVTNSTQLYIANSTYTSLATVTYSQIIFTTLQETTYPDLNLPVSVRVGLNLSVCLSSSCEFRWATSVTPYLDSVEPQNITGPTNLTFTGRNLLGGGGTYTNAHLTIDSISCNVTAMTNKTMNCSIDGVEVGGHQVFGSIDGVGNIQSTIRITSEGTLFGASPTINSIYGGAFLIISGYGFSLNINNSQVLIGMNSCPIIQSTGTEIHCIIPAQDNSSDMANIIVQSNMITFSPLLSLNYSTELTPNVISVNVTSSNGSIFLQITGNNFGDNNTSYVNVGNSLCSIINFTSTSIICVISSDLGAGRHPVIVHVDGIGNSNSNITYTHYLLVSSISPMEGSYGGGLPVTVLGKGFNTTNITVSVCNRTCSSVTIVSNTELICVTPSVSMDEVNNSCNLTVTVDDVSQNALFTYKTNLTATVSSVSPVRGGTGGGTILTIKGTNFPNATDRVSVRVGDVICSVRTINSTTITCQTGRYFQKSVDVFVTVLINGSGYATGSVQFQYINLWSSRWTWGGDIPPEAGTLVQINNGVTVFLDITTPILTGLIIDNATLSFDDLQDVELNVEYIVILNGGILQVGTESNPFQHYATITLYGQLRSIELPIFGAKVIALRDGTLELHGKPTIRTWTQLGATAINGSSIITLAKPVDWSINSEIIIATTNDRLSQRENELRQITNISFDRLTLTLDQPLQYTHLGVSQQLNTTTIEVRGEVGLLSHNVIVQGSVTATWNDTIPACPTGYNPDENVVQTCSMGRYGEEVGSDQFGATIMASQYINSTNDTQRVFIRLSNVELYNVGQAFRLNRFPLNFYMNGNMSLSYIKSCSIHYSFNRAINIQASNYITIENNVIYNIMGGAVFLADGVEIGNVFRGNLAVFVRASSSLLNEDFTPAAFWLTNPNNTVEHNAVAGCSHYGYWYQFRNQPNGLSADLTPNYCPYKQPFGRFYNNSVHSTGRYGVWIYPQYMSTVSGECNDLRPSVAVFESLVSWKNDKGIEWVMSSTILIKNALTFDNTETGISCIDAVQQGDINPTYLRPTFYNAENGSSVINSIIIGDTNILDTLSLPSIAGLIGPWKRGFLVQNVTFINFLSNQTPAISESTTFGSYAYSYGGWVTKFSNISFINVALRGLFRWSYDSLYEDEDGTLSGQNESMIIMAPDGLTNESSSCTPAPYFDNAVQCSLSGGPWVRLWLQAKDIWLDYFLSNPLIVSNEYNNSTRVASFPTYYGGPSGYVVAFQVNHTYEISTDNIQDWYDITYLAFIYDLAPGDYLIIQHRMEPRLYGDFFNKSITPLSGSSNNHGEWFYDSNTKLFSYMIKNPITAGSITDIRIDFIVHTCPGCMDCECPTTTTQTTTTATTQTTTSETTVSTTTLEPITCDYVKPKYWSNDSHWTFPQDYPNWNRTKPGNNQNIVIPQCIRLIIDCPLPIIRSLRIDGILEFQQGRNHIMYVDSISINGGQLIAGSPDNTFNGSVDIILTANNPINIALPQNFPTIQPRMIGVLGCLDLHGSPHNITWTRLARTASSGAYLINLSQSVDWTIGDEIIITTTDQSISHTERHRIASIINSTIILTEQPLAYTHVVIRHKFPNRQVVHVAAAVGLLTRNIRVISQVQAPSLSGFQILITGYQSLDVNIYYKGYARLSNVQFIGFAQFDDSPLTSDQRTGIYMNQLGNLNPSIPTYIDGCSFDGGYNGAIGMTSTNGILITNNIIYNTYRTGIVITGRDNLVQNNLVSTIYWTGTAQQLSVAQFSMNYDGAIMARDRYSYRVIMRDNLVAGAERLAYRIRGNPCTQTNIPTSLLNDFSNNEAHSVMSGVTLWPSDKVYPYDQECVLIQGFKIYKGWYYGFYLNTPRNITIDSCSSIDSQIGIFTFVVGISPVSHLIIPSRVIIQNSMIVGSITPNDCADQINKNSVNIIYSQSAIPTVSPRMINNITSGRSGIIFPTVSPRNNMPSSAWTGINDYPCLDGSMSINNSTIAFFNNVCNRHDTAIQVSQSNDDGQFPIITNSIYRYNISDSNVIFNGLPNLEKVIPSACVDMDCDGLKKDLIIDTDGTLFNLPTSVFSQAESLWGNIQHGVGDFRLPREFLTDLNGNKINISSIYPYRGITRSSWCTPQPLWGMHRCDYQLDYRMLIIEDMDADTERRRISPVSIASDNGYIDLINGPQDHSVYNGYTSQQRISTFMAIVESNRTYQIYFTATPPNYLRFRLLNGNSSIKCILAIFYPSLQQIDIYANTIYVSPTNRDMRYNFILLKDENNTVTLSSPAGTNYFDRKYNLAYFAIDGSTTIELKISPLFILSFGLPAMDPNAVYVGDVTSKLAALFQLDPTKIRTVKIVPETQPNGRRRRQITPCTLTVELRDEPRTTSIGSDGIRGEILTNSASTIINRYQAGELQNGWQDLNITNDVIPTLMAVKEPFNNTNFNLSIINRTELRTSPGECREQSPCTIQPVLVAYDADNNIIQKLGSKDRPWQVIATVINQTNVTISGAIANYSDGQTQYSLFSLPNIGTYQIQFTFIQPDGVSSTFFQTANLTVEADAPISVTNAILDGQQVNNIYVVDVNQTFTISLMPIDSITRRPLAVIQWGNWTWTVNVTLGSLPKYNRQAALIRNRLSRTNINLQTGIITVTGLTINATGMFVLNIGLTSTNNEHSITLTSSGILVKDIDNDTFVSAINELSSNINFTGDYDALSATNQLELKRAMIYNYLLSIGMPLISDIVLMKGSIIALFQVDAFTTNISQAVASILSNPNSIPDLTVSSVTINRQSYSKSVGSSSTNTNEPPPMRDDGKTTGMIVGIVIGLVAALLLVAIGGIVFYRRRHPHLKGRHIPGGLPLVGMASDRNFPVNYEEHLKKVNTPLSLNKRVHPLPPIQNNIRDLDEISIREATD